MELGREAQRNRSLYFIEEDLRHLANRLELEIALTQTPEEAHAIGARVEELVRDLIRVSGHCVDRANETAHPVATYSERAAS